MSFDDDVDALRAERATSAFERDALFVAGKAAFDDEVRTLWHETLEYWNGRKAPMTAREVHYILTGKYLEDGADELVPRPFPTVQVFKRGQSSAPPARSATENVGGLDIRGWFALCEPGEVRELLPSDRSRGAEDQTFPAWDVASIIQDAKNQVAYGYATRFTQSTEPPQRIKGASERLGGYATFFSASAGGTDIALSCSAEGPIQVLQAQERSWVGVATLRELIVEAVADLF